MKRLLSLWMALLCAGCLTSKPSNRQPQATPLDVTSPAGAIPVPSLAAGFKTALVKVRRVTGLVQFASAGGNWSALKANQVVPPGTWLATGEHSGADLFLNNSVVRISPNTLLAVETLSAAFQGTEMVYRTRLDLKQGEILGNVKKLASASSYELATPRGVARIRGTDFILCGGGKVASLQGSIVVESGGGEHAINTGEYFDPGDNKVKTLSPDVIFRGRSMYDCVQHRPTGFGRSGTFETIYPFAAAVRRAQHQMNGLPAQFYFDIEPLEVETDIPVPTPKTVFCE